MKILDKINKIVKKAAEDVEFEITYIPGITEEDDQYKAVNEKLSITCYGSSEKEALENARIAAEAFFLENHSKAYR